ncbi:type IV secretory system conjugative DNA transfer family protein [Streptomyces sp. C36]|uniref:type IV secretory system conjugative DNA transfer family protein n=1 Tax=Streptomyces sp. C36 TaxID=3237122 RepID=UPI0034C60F92
MTPVRDRDDRNRGSERGIPDGLLVSVIAFLLGMTLLVWTATGIAAFFANGAWPKGVTFVGTAQALRHLMTQPRDLPAAWPEAAPEALSGYGLFWGVLISEVLVAVVLMTFAIGTVARWRAVRARKGEGAVVAASVATVASVPAQAAPVEAPVTEQGAPVSVPEPRTPTAATATATPATDVPSTPRRLVYATDRAVLSALATQAVLEAAGPVLVVTSDPALWAGTKAARAKLGPVHVFDPTHLLDTPDRLRWNPAAGCEARDTAAARATALLAPVRPLSTLDSATADTAETLLRCWLHAVAVDGRPFRQVHRWAQGTSAHEPVRILRTNPKAVGGTAGELESALTGHPERRDMALQLAASALTALTSVHIRDACNPNRANSSALESFVPEGGTLYVVGEAIEDPRTRPGAMPLLTALASSVVEHGRRMAARSSSGRLDPPLTLVLDDVAAVAPLPALPDLLTAGEAQGLPTVALMRSEEQARARWPRHTLSTG